MCVVGAQYTIFRNFSLIGYTFLNNLLLKFWSLSFILLFLGFLVSYFSGTLVSNLSIYGIHRFALAYALYSLPYNLHLLQFRFKIKDQTEGFERLVLFSIIFI